MELISKGVRWVNVCAPPYKPTACGLPLAAPGWSMLNLETQIYVKFSKVNRVFH